MADMHKTPELALTLRAYAQTAPSLMRPHLAAAAKQRAADIIAMRHRVYPRWVAAGKLTQAKADSEIAAMTAVRDSLATIAAAEGAR